MTTSELKHGSTPPAAEVNCVCVWGGGEIGGLIIVERERGLGGKETG